MNALDPVLRAIAPESALAAEPDPTQWRRGFPPPAERQIGIEDGALFRFRQLRWSFSHARELGPTKAVWRGDGAATLLERAGQGPGDLAFNGHDGARLTLAQSLAQTCADGFVCCTGAASSIRRGADRGHFKAANYSTLPGFSYRNIWWATHNALAAFLARGIQGQSLYVDPVAEVTIARFASFPQAANRHNDPLTFPVYRAIIEALGA